MDKVKFAELVNVLKQLQRGTHNINPTRHLYPNNAVAMELDRWWLNYFQSAEHTNRQLAAQALDLVNALYPFEVEDHNTVRVLRVIEYVGPREWVESTIEKSVVGTRQIDKDKKIHAATIGLYPEYLHPPTKG